MTELRDATFPAAYWDHWIVFRTKVIGDTWQVLKEPDIDLDYAPQFVRQASHYALERILMRYSRGEPVETLRAGFEDVLAPWEESERLGRAVWDEERWFTRNAWPLNLDHYVRCFWLAGLALTLDVPEDQWLRLLKLMGNEGNDALLDRVIATRQVGRRIGDSLCFPKAYAGLLDVVNAPSAERGTKLATYLDVWLRDLEDAGSPSLPRDHRTPYWWTFCADTGRGAKGAYFGCWCVEAAAVVRAFSIDDVACLQHTSYPGDLVHDGRAPRHGPPVEVAPAQVQRPPLLRRIFSRKGNNAGSRE